MRTANTVADVVALLGAGVLLMLAGCGGGGGGTGPGKTAAQWTLEGWGAFEGDDYTTAASRFQQAISTDPSYADAYNGLGWSDSKMDRLSDAVAQFNLGLSKPSTTIVHYEILAGKAFTYNAQGGLNVTPAISAAESVATYSPSFAFSHDPKVTISDVHLLLAECYASQGDFLSALRHVQAIESTFIADVATASGRALLLDEIEWLRTRV